MSATCPRGSIIILYYLIAKYGQLLVKSISNLAHSGHAVSSCFTRRNAVSRDGKIAQPRGAARRELFEAPHLWGNNNNNDKSLSKNSRKDGNCALPPIMESDCEKWKIP